MFELLTDTDTDSDTDALRCANIIYKAMLRFCQEFGVVGGEVEHTLYAYKRF